MEVREKLRSDDQARDYRRAGLACRHHWLIESPDGPACGGVCKLCGAERQFPTSSDDYLVDDADILSSAVSSSRCLTLRAIICG